MVNSKNGEAAPVILCEVACPLLNAPFRDSTKLQPFIVHWPSNVTLAVDVAGACLTANIIRRRNVRAKAKDHHLAIRMSKYEWRTPVVAKDSAPRNLLV